MAHTVLARERFNSTRAAVQRLNDVKLAIMLEGEEWHPDNGVKVRSGISDPTGKQAIYRADELPQIMASLKAEERDLETFIGTTLAIIEAVRVGLGDKYANVLDARYIDCWQWSQVESEYGITRQTGNYLINVACDWVDSIGIRELLRGETEL